MRAPLGLANASMLVSAVAFCVVSASGSDPGGGNTSRYVAAAPVPDDVRFVQPLAASDAELQAAFESNPFSETRERPDTRYGEFTVQGQSSTAPAPDIRNVRLLGTTVAGPESFALLQEPGGRPVILKLNHDFHGYTAAVIERGRLVLEARDSSFVFEMKEGHQP
ncbi:MAG: hypothetical protein ACT443_07820 [Gemmatimonadota bacterium]